MQFKSNWINEAKDYTTAEIWKRKTMSIRSPVNILIIWTRLFLISSTKSGYSSFSLFATLIDTSTQKIRASIGLLFSFRNRIVKKFLKTGIKTKETN